MGEALRLRLGEALRLGDALRLGEALRLGDALRLRLGDALRLGEALRLGDFLGDDLRGDCRDKGTLPKVLLPNICCPIFPDFNTQRPESGLHI